MHAWSARHVPAQGGKVAVVTGANSGLGWQLAETLAAKGATVVMGCRDAARAAQAADAIRRLHPDARVEVDALDLADLASIARFAADVAERHGRVDILCNNAGVMFLPLRHTRDGFEMQFGTNHLGHFALTGHLLPALRAARRPRVVTMSSGLNRGGRIRVDDLRAERRYNRYLAYCDSKLANLVFAIELQRRFERAAFAGISVAAHPGYAATNLQFAGPAMDSSPTRAALMRAANRYLAQPADQGALPAIHAATAPDLAGGAYIGPSGWFESRGLPAPASVPRAARDVGSAALLWEASEAATGVRFLSSGAPAGRSPGRPFDTAAEAR
ncbi:oxidoreductase [Burkholderia cepacia]|uniref:oxidoreductase n=1 Tax=Burkholderia cepacia TaxID=292 RepID=UPI000758FE91|nr:oxidoreductase [Burkholderia cepacia]KVW11786.1 short-chain dehydrogenase [Burkholderia cepacia]RRA05203.1 SDR family NAD(P)-dependent oxidoreductase [Burkholderia cepacia]RRA09581.1 SDR family NAD(P)-dependent oxidoreductase [Burkholderia cepacia]